MCDHLKERTLKISTRQNKSQTSAFFPICLSHVTHSLSVCIIVCWCYDVYT
jgi:hypothetical protein